MELFKLLGKITLEGTKEAESQLENLKSKFASGAKTIGKAIAGISAAGVGIATAIGAASVKVGSAFSSQMSTVASISGATADELEILKEKAKEMGATTSFSATESAQAFEYMAMAGWDAQQMTDGLSGVMNLAAASGEDLATASDIVTDAMTAFGMKAEESEYFSDVLAKTASSANTNVSLMGETFKYVAPLAGAMGYSIEDMSVAIGLMANSGIKGSQSGTSLRNIITNLASPTDDVAAAMESLGVSLTDNDGNIKSFDETLCDLRESFSQLDEVERANYASTIAGKEGMSGFLALINASEDDFDKLSEQIENCSGAAKEMADIRLDNLSGDVTLFKSALEGAGIEISEQLSPMLRDLTQKATSAIPKIADKIILVFEKAIKFLTSSFFPALKKFGDYFSETILPSIESFVKYVGSKLFKILQNIVKYVQSDSKSLKVLKSVFSEVLNIVKKCAKVLLEFADVLTANTAGSELLRDVLIGITGALLIYKAATIGTTVVIKLMTAAQKALNATNPMGWLLIAGGAVAGLIGGLVNLTGVVSDCKEENVEMSASVKQTLEYSKKINDEAKELRTELKETGKEVGNEYDGYKRLADQLGDMVDSSGNIKPGMEDAVELIINDLNPALDTSLEIVDGQLQGYKDISKEIDNIILKKEAENLMDENKDTYADSLKGLQDALAQKKSNETEIENILKDVNEKTGFDFTAEGIKDAAYPDPNSTHVVYNDEDIEVIKQAAADIEGLETSAAIAQSAADKNTAIMNKLNDLTQAVYNNDYEAMQRQIDIFTTGLKVAGEASVAELYAQKEKQGTVLESMIEEQKEGNIHITNEMIDTQKRISKLATDEYDKSVKLANQKGKEEVNSYADGMNQSKGAVEEAGKSTGEAGANAAKSVDYYSIGYEKGVDFADGLLSQIQSGIYSAKEAINEFVNSQEYNTGEINIASFVQASKDTLAGHAKGGIVTREHIARVGEDGAEAIIPLEKNTEWIDRVAERMSGSTSNSAVAAKLDELISLLKNQKIYLDGKTLVGGISGEMDKKLGSMARFKRRGVNA